MGYPVTILFAAMVLWLVGWLQTWRLLAGRLRAPGGADGKSLLSPVSIIVPARNEEHNLPVLLRSIKAQSSRAAEIIVVDDESTDLTAEVARQHGATVLASKPLPEGWRGKTWACEQGARAARGDLLLFLDADAWFETDGLANILANYNGGALSVGPYHATRRPYEQLSLFFNLVMTAGTLPHGLFGQMLLVDRESYRRAGGHEAVKGRILENFFLASRLRAVGTTVVSMAGKGAISFRMYPHGLRELIEGWTKAYASGAGQTPRAVLVLIVAWLSGMMLAPISLKLGWYGFAMYLLYVIQLKCALRPVGAFRWYAAVLYPVPLIFFFALFARSALRSRRLVEWKGREIRAD